MTWPANQFDSQLTRRRAVIGAFALLLAPLWRPAMAFARGAVKGNHMNESDQEFGKRNPHAPLELSRFAFLIGNWQCEAKIRSASGEWQSFAAEWHGCFILDGYAIADEYRMTGASGELIVLGMNFRTYDAARRIWNIKWLNALAGSWMDLASEELGAVKFDGPSVIYSFKETVGGLAYTQVTYTSHSATHFTWRAQKSDDRKTWADFMTVEAHRKK